MEFIDLKAQYRAYKTEIDKAITGIVESTQFIQGPVIRELETELAAYLGVRHAITCASGTDALLLPMMAFGVQPGDEILVPDFTFIATAEMVAFIGATPVFVDVDDKTYNLNPDDLARKITSRSKGIIPVSLYGQCADLDAINAIAARHGLWVMEDGAQSFGALYKDLRRKSGTLTRVATTSFFPAKPLGCYGDGGAMFTNDDNLAAELRCYLNHGQAQRYHHKRIGINGRFDSLQAAIVRVKLRHFDDEVIARQRIADWYTELLKGKVITPHIEPGNRSVWAQYTIRTPRREEVCEHLKNKNIPTAVHYPIPLHRQECFRHLDVADTSCPISCKLSAEVMSLPMHPFLTRTEVERVATSVLEAIGD